MLTDNESYYYFLIKYLILQTIFQENQENNPDSRVPLQQHFTCTQKCYVWFYIDACTFLLEASPQVAYISFVLT